MNPQFVSTSAYHSKSEVGRKAVASTTIVSQALPLRSDVSSNFEL